MLKRTVLVIFTDVGNRILCRLSDGASIALEPVIVTGVTADCNQPPHTPELISDGLGDSPDDWIENEFSPISLWPP